MEILSHFDALRILASVAALNTEMSRETLPQRIFTAVANCVEADITALDGFGNDTTYTGRLWYDPVDSVSNEELEIFAAHTHEHPFFIGMLVDKKPDVMKITDYLSTDQFHRTGIYNEFYKKVGVERQVAFAMNITPELLVTCALSRTRRDFNERDRAMLGHLAPHLIAAFRNTQALDRVKNELSAVNAHTRSGLIIVTGAGRVKLMTSRAISFLQEYFAHTSDAILPSSLLKYVREQARVAAGVEYYVPTSPMLIRGSSGSLRIHVTLSSQSDDLTLVLEEVRQRSISDFLSPSLTRREAEIVYWISKGKTDPEIASICSISVRTVHKHLEHIFTKLGVETRTAAVMAVLDETE